MDSIERNYKRLRVMMRTSDDELVEVEETLIRRNAIWTAKMANDEEWCGVFLDFHFFI